MAARIGRNSKGTGTGGGAPRRQCVGHQGCQQHNTRRRLQKASLQQAVRQERRQDQAAHQGDALHDTFAILSHRFASLLSKANT